MVAESNEFYAFATDKNLDEILFCQNDKVMNLSVVYDDRFLQSTWKVHL